MNSSRNGTERPKAMGNPSPNPTVHTDAQRRLVQTLYRMRYGPLMGVTPNWEDDIVTFLNDVIIWLDALNDKLVIVAETTTNMQTELDRFRQQQQAVRDFLGLTHPEKGPA